MPLKEATLASSSPWRSEPPPRSRDAPEPMLAAPLHCRDLTGVSTDGGETFSPSSRGLTGLRISDVAQIGKELLVAVRYAGPGSGVDISSDGGGSFQGQPAALPTVLDFSVANDRVYAATEKGLWERLGGQWRRINDTSITPYSSPPLAKATAGTLRRWRFI